MSFRVTTVNLSTNVETAEGPSSSLHAAIRKARAYTDGGLLGGPTNEARVYEGSTLLHRFRKLTHGSLTSRGGSFRARPVEVDAKGSPGTTVRILGVALTPEAGSEVVQQMFESARARAGV